MRPAAGGRFACQIIVPADRLDIVNDPVTFRVSRHLFEAMRAEVTAIAATRPSGAGLTVFPAPLGSAPGRRSRLSARLDGRDGLLRRH
jgi:hypothetical protein